MSGSYLLDTNIVIALFKNDSSVLPRFNQASVFYVPTIVLGELYYGASHSSDVTRHTNQVREFASPSLVLGCDAQTAEVYGRVKSALKSKGRPIPENDIWIAAISVQYDLTLASREVDGLKLEHW